MKIKEELHRSRLHREGFDPSCLDCLQTHGIDGIINHLKEKSRQNQQDADRSHDSHARAVSREQDRMIGILRLYQKAMGEL